VCRCPAGQVVHRRTAASRALFHQQWTYQLLLLPTLPWTPADGDTHIHALYNSTISSTHMIGGRSLGLPQQINEIGFPKVSCIMENIDMGRHRLST
jgi:hypothetical protein